MVEDLVAALRAGRMTVEELFDRLPMAPALEVLVMAEWRGADEPVKEISRTMPATIAEGLHVHCGCGCEFQFRPDATRARCPDCGARYEITTK